MPADSLLALKHLTVGTEMSDADSLEDVGEGVERELILLDRRLSVLDSRKMLHKGGAKMREVCT